MREAGNENPYEGEYSLEAMKQAMLAEGVGQPDWNGNPTPFTIFGGEPLLLPINDLEELLEWGKERGVTPGLQTNGSLITERHFALFKKFGVHVGVSIDGPEELNDARQAKAVSATRATTAKSIANLERLLADKIGASLIVTLSSVNAGTDERLSKLITWILALQDKGLRYVNFHSLEIDTATGASLALDQERQIAVMRTLYKDLRGKGLQISPFEDMKRQLLQESGANCIWHYCDPYTTAAVRAIDGQGNRGNCGRTNKDGVMYEKSSTAGHERNLALYLTPQEYGGCQGCKFFLACGGGNCPGEAIAGDWRNRTTQCKSIYTLFEDIEMDLMLEGKEPISASPKRPMLEAQLLGQWTGQPITGTINVEHGDRPHGDKPHGDHTDEANPVIT